MPHDNMKQHRFGTRAIHAGQQPDPSTGAIMTPIYQTSTYVQEAPEVHKGYEYSRVSNPTRTALESNLASLEGAEHGICFASGVAAADAIVRRLQPGDHVVAMNDLYGGTYRLFRRIFEPVGIRFDFVDLTDLAAAEAAIKPETRLLWLETPTNPLLRIVDIRALTELARSRGITSVVDNTFASPYLQQPLALGADLVTHSATKYLGGHSDVIGGVVCTNDAEWAEHLRFQIKCTGAAPGPMDCFLILRGTKTLHLRMERHCSNARAIAVYLQEHAAVRQVLYPGLPDHPGHETAKRQMKDFGGMISFTLKNDAVEAGVRLLKATKVFSLAESLGGVESLIEHPATMTHGSVPAEVRRAAGLEDSLIRLSVGVEDVDDLLEDLEQALSIV